MKIHRRDILLIILFFGLLGLLIAFYGKLFNSGGPEKIPVIESHSLDTSPTISVKPRDLSEDEVKKERAIKELAVALSKMIAPPPATAMDWREAKVTGNALNGGAIQYWTLVKMRPILEADTNTNSSHVRASNRRSPDGEIITTIWSNKILNTLEISWSKGVIEKWPQDRADGTMFSQTHPEQKTRYHRDIGYAHFPPDRIQPCIVVSIHGENGKITGPPPIPFDYTPYLTLAAFVPSSYPIGAMPELAKMTGKQSYIMLVDTDRGRIVGEVPLPADLSGRPTFILDKENDVLLATQFELSWLIAIDLRSYMHEK